MVEPLRHRQTKEAANGYVQPTATASHLDSTRLGDTTKPLQYTQNRYHHDLSGRIPAARPRKPHAAKDQGDSHGCNRGQDQGDGPYLARAVQISQTEPAAWWSAPSSLYRAMAATMVRRRALRPSASWGAISPSRKVMPPRALPRCRSCRASNRSLASSNASSVSCGSWEWSM